MSAGDLYYYAALEGTMTSDTAITLGSRWHRNGGREIVRVERVWDWPGQGLTVRAHPTHGGKPLVADADWFRENYTELSNVTP